MLRRIYYAREHDNQTTRLYSRIMRSRDEHQQDRRIVLYVAEKNAEKIGSYRKKCMRKNVNGNATSGPESIWEKYIVRRSSTGPPEPTEAIGEDKEIQFINVWSLLAIEFE